MFYPHVKSESLYKTTLFQLKRFFLRRKEDFSKKGHKISLVHETDIISISNEIYMTYECYIKLPIQMFELNWTILIHKNPHLIKCVDRSINHLLIRRYCVVPFI